MANCIACGKQVTHGSVVCGECAKSAEEFVAERDSALLSLDRDRILSYMGKYGIAPRENDLVFWAGIHKAIVSINSATQEQKERSAEWLLEHGFAQFVAPVPQYREEGNDA